MKKPKVDWNIRSWEYVLQGMVILMVIAFVFQLVLLALAIWQFGG